MILGGKMRVTRNGMTERTTKPHLPFRIGDRILFMRGQSLIHVEMLGVPTRRGPAKEAQSHYKIVPLDVGSFALDE